MRLRRLVFALVGLVVLGLPSGASAEGSCPNEAVRAQQSARSLPDCRAYEMVSPADKNGNGVSSFTLQVRSSGDGDAVEYVSIAGFADVFGGTVNGVSYISRRGVDDWSTHAITPPQDPPAFPASKTSKWEGEFSSDLSTGVFLDLSPVLTGHPHVDGVANLYLGSDLLAGPPVSFQLLSDAVEQLPSESELSQHTHIVLTGTSVDFRHVIFETTDNLTADASGEEPKLYEWEGGIVRLVGILPGGAPAASSLAGRGAVESNFYTTGTISEDGSRIVFTVPAPGEAFRGSGDLYMRVDHATTVQLNVSEQGGGGGGGSQPAEFWAASADDSKVFFTASQQLTDTPGGGVYVYDVNASAGHHLTLIGEQGDGVMGTSRDGSYVYFWSRSDLVSGHPIITEEPRWPESAKRQLYVWHDGTIRWVGAGWEGGTTYDSSWNEQYLFLASGSRVAPDGKHVVFTTLNHDMAALFGVDNISSSGDVCNHEQFACTETYVYSYDTNRLACPSCDTGGAPPVGDSLFGYAQRGEKGPSSGDMTQHLNHALADDGSRVFFTTLNALVPGDKNGMYDVYEYDTVSGSLSLVSSGQSESDSFFMDASSDGRDVFFTSRERLTSGDVDGEMDLYDARVDGGFERSAGTSGCVGDECQGLPGVPSGFAVPASVSSSGSGNLAAGVSKPAVKPAKRKAKAKKRRARKRHRGKMHAKKGGKSAKGSGRSGKSASRRPGR